MSPSRVLALSSASFVAGVTLASFYGSAGRYLPAFLILALSLAISFGPKPVLPAILILSFAGIGSLWFSLSDVRGSEELSHFRGTVIEQPDLRETSARFVLSGGLLLVTERHAGYRYGDILEVKGRIVSPDPFDGFDYPGYLAKDGIRLVAYNPEVEMVGRNRTVRSISMELKERAVANLRSSLPEPHSSIAAAMFLGEKRGVSSKWQEKLSAAGIRHVTAVSGLHVTVAAAIAMTLFAGLGKRRSALLVIVAIFLFVLMTGMQPSAIRAGIMGSCLVVAGLVGRMSSSSRNVLLAASLMLLFNPLLLKHDIGFQLSFLAVIGIIRLSPSIGKRLRFLPPVARDVTAMSLAAYIFTLPVALYHFGQVSLVFPVTNLLIVPILHIVMMFGLAFIFLSFLSAPITSVIAIPLWLLLSYFIAVVNLISGLPWASVAVGSVGPVLVAAFYLILLTGKKGSDVIESEDEAIFSEGIPVGGIDVGPSGRGWQSQ